MTQKFMIATASHKNRRIGVFGAACTAALADGSADVNAVCRSGR